MLKLEVKKRREVKQIGRTACPVMKYHSSKVKVERLEAF